MKYSIRIKVSHIENLTYEEDIDESDLLQSIVEKFQDRKELKKLLNKDQNLEIEARIYDENDKWLGDKSIWYGKNGSIRTDDIVEDDEEDDDE